MPTTLESLPWHTQLANYGIPDPADLDPDDADATLLPRLVEKSVLPRLAAVVDAYNPRSARQTALFIKLVGQMLDYTKASGKAFLVLMAAIEQRLEADVVATSTRYSFASVQIRIEPGQQAPHALAARDRWFWTIFKQLTLDIANVQLFKNLLAWKRHIARPKLHAWTIDTLLNRMLLPAIDASVSLGPTSFDSDLDKLHRISELIPPEWIGDGYATPPFLQPLEARVAALADRTAGPAEYPRCVSQLTHQPSPTRPFNERLAAVLVIIQSFDRASKVAKRYK
ncbi:hypothetical protein BDK51DRAFT_43233 [Blyttiomyces helicus]|uniref:GCF C-terminal domain-containing protein n=1 Tax=Blyttiomyces helicus TaxID=388810 RepID=A0A4P9WJL6_9FUNG|nr:hypothetical protein BDK51DRAFT_43233 [Blyttiomyces helicus]|eukprot:RKO91330.1 hypothetical protein BDK51DRAFT_43233 [Blyttiomyces helicus]